MQIIYANLFAAVMSLVILAFPTPDELFTSIKDNFAPQQESRDFDVEYASYPDGEYFNKETTEFTTLDFDVMGCDDQLGKASETRVSACGNITQAIAQDQAGDKEFEPRLLPSRSALELAVTKVCRERWEIASSSNQLFDLAACMDRGTGVASN